MLILICQSTELISIIYNFILIMTINRLINRKTNIQTNKLFLTICETLFLFQIHPAVAFERYRFFEIGQIIFITMISD